MSRSHEPADAASERNGWRLYAWRDFGTDFAALSAEVGVLRQEDPTGYEAHPKAKLLATVLRLVRDVIPSDPGAEIFRQGNTLGASHRHWFRAKFHQRFRLFFRFHSQSKIIVYVWMNDENSLRKSGSRTDPYNVFKRMIEHGAPPSDFEALLKESRGLQLPSESTEAADSHDADAGPTSSGPVSK